MANSRRNGRGAADELYRAQLDVRKKRADAEIARAQALVDADIAVDQSYYEAVFEVAKSAIDRARSSAETLQKAAGAVVTLYTGALALAFSVGESPLPGKALFAAVLLGLAVVCSTAFVAFLPDRHSANGDEGGSGAATEAPVSAVAGAGSGMPGDDPPGGGSEGGDSAHREVRDWRPDGELRADILVAWTRGAALRNSKVLRAGVAALAGAVVLMPAPFVTIDPSPDGQAQVEWPQPPPAVGDGGDELREILYTAQVEEAAERRARPIAEDGADWFWWALFGIGLTGVAGAAALPVRD